MPTGGTNDEHGRRSLLGDVERERALVLVEPIKPGNVAVEGVDQESRWLLAP